MNLAQVYLLGSRKVFAYGDAIQVVGSAKPGVHVMLDRLSVPNIFSVLDFLGAKPMIEENKCVLVPDDPCDTALYLRHTPGVEFSLKSFGEIDRFVWTKDGHLLQNGNHVEDSVALELAGDKVLFVYKELK